jgi:anaphase-promoting complex subunit 6
LQGDLVSAIENYHIALGIRPEDTFTAEMLTAALQEECIQYSRELVLAG